MGHALWQALWIKKLEQIVSDTKKYLIELVQQLMDCSGSEEELDEILVKVKSMVVDPYISDYIYWSDLSAEEVVEKALSYKPICL